MAGCESQLTAQEEIRTVGRRVHEEAWSQGKMNVLDEYYTPDFVRHIPHPSLEIRGIDEYKKYIASIRNKYPDIQITIHEIIVKRNTCVIHLNKSIIPPKGKKLTYSGCILNHWVNGKVVEEWVYFDRLDILQQLGYKLVPPEEQGEE